jgi:PleD family two-component response regulator
MFRQTNADHYRLTHVQRLTAARKHLENNRVDVVLLDLDLSDSQGLDTVRQVHAVAPSVPIVVLSRLDDEARAIQALQEGAQDYLVKCQIGAHLLLRAIRYAIERHRMQAALRSLSLIDDLTGLYNRRGFFTLAEQCLKMSRRNGSAFLMVFLDLDGLKQINDRFGHSEAIWP